MVNKDPYFEGHETKKRWMSYWYQIKEVLATKPKKVLEVGIGNKTVANYLKGRKIEGRKIDVTTADLNKDFDPDVVCNITELSKTFNHNSFDTILSAQTLEHLPFAKFEICLREMKKVARKYVVITLPYSCVKVQFKFRLPLIGERSLLIKFSTLMKHRFTGTEGHYWEVGKSNYRVEKVKDAISKHFKIEKDYVFEENPYHRCFVLKK